MQDKWIRKPQAETSVVFVHGILSSGETCWRHKNCSYWPELLKDELELGMLGIYVFTYQTGIFSGSYRLSDIVDALKEHMRLDGVQKSDRLIFVCHSMGGIVVRKFILERATELIEAEKEIGLFLVGSPSLGSSYADWLAPLAQCFGHAQAAALRFVRDNDWLMDLDKEFMNLKETAKLKISGKELVEDKFVVLNKFLRRQVVEPFSGARYFGESFKVAGSDHFSIAKPKDKDAIQHRLLCQFIKDTMVDVGVKRNDEPPTSGGKKNILKEIQKLLNENEAIHKLYGPNFDSASSSDSLFPIGRAALWRQRKVEKIIPNNNTIVKIFEANFDLFTPDEIKTFSQFREHAIAFEKNTHERIDRTAQPVFPPEFKAMIQERANK